MEIELQDGWNYLLSNLLLSLSFLTWTNRMLMSNSNYSCLLFMLMLSEFYVLLVLVFYLH